MAYTKIVKSVRTLKGMELDVRGVPLLGKELKDVIYNSVAYTQKFVITELPAWLIVSHRQFISLNAYTEEMFNTKDRIFYTPLNVMEVVVNEDLDPVNMEQFGVSPEEIHAISLITSMGEDHI